VLVLSRKKDESILFGDGEIKVVVVEIRGDKVRLGIEAPKELSVHRMEVYAAIKREENKRLAEEKKQQQATPPTAEGEAASEQTENS
jgi:carbon storage regulator